MLAYLSGTSDHAHLNISILRNIGTKKNCPGKTVAAWIIENSHSIGTKKGIISEPGILLPYPYGPFVP